MGRMVGNGIIAAEAAVTMTPLITVPLLAVPACGRCAVTDAASAQFWRSTRSNAGLPHIVPLAHPTTGGVTACSPCLATCRSPSRGPSSALPVAG